MIGCTPRWRRALRFVLFLLMFAAPVRGEEKATVTLKDESDAAKKQLDQARERLAQRQWSQAIEDLQTLLTTTGNDLVLLTPKDAVPSHSVSVRRLCQVQLASVPAEALRLYRQRYESQAAKKLHRASTQRDVLQLSKLVEEAFCTRAAEKAIDLLGDLAFERGRFDEAEQWWRLLAPLPDSRRDPAVRGLTLVYPDPSLDPARLQAKQLLARLFREPHDDGQAQRAAFGKRYPKAEGTLAGRKGRYVDLLRTLADEREKAGGAGPWDWPTFGGDGTRGRTIAASNDVLDHLSALCREGPTWSFNLEQRTRQEDAEPSPAVDAAQARTLAFHPVIVGHQVWVADARYVTAFDLRNGKSQECLDIAAVPNGGVAPNLTLPAPPDLRYTLSVAGGHAYARLGAQDIGVEAPVPQPRPGRRQPRRDNETFLACLSLSPDDKGKYFRWQIGGITPRDNSLFEGDPLLGDGLMWIASTRYQGQDCISAIDCYTSEDATAPPLRWRREVCKTTAPKVGEPRYRHHLLTRAGSRIVYCTHSGAIVAVDALTGRTNWAIRYRRGTSEEGERALRDLTPPLFAAGRLFVAPADADSLLCLDAETGRTLWELEATPVVHLLGVAGGRLIFTTAKGLRAVDAETGDPLWSFPQEGELTPAGRGLLIGDLVLFPTTQQRHPASPTLEGTVYVVRQHDGRAADDPAQMPRLPAGNFAFANGCLVVADRKTLFAFVPPRLLSGQRRAQISAAERQRRLIQEAQRAAEAEHWDDAETALRQAATLAHSPRHRLHALLRAAQIWRDARQSARARKVWETIQADPVLREIQVIDREGKPSVIRSPPAARRSRPPVANAPDSPADGGKRTADDGQTLPLFRTWHVRFGQDEWVLAGWRQCDPDLLLTGSPDGRFTCRLTSTGEIRWQHRLPFAPRWAACHADVLLAAGEEGIACLRRDNGELLWYFPAPVSGHYPHAALDEVRVVVGTRTPEPLTAFRFAAGRLFFLQGQRRLFAIGVDKGSVLWQRWAPDGELRLPFPRGCFAPFYRATAQTVLVQMAGRRWLLEAATGRLLHEAEDGRDLWQRPPLELDEQTLCVTPDNRHVVLLNARTGQAKWTHPIRGDTTLSGEVSALLGRGDVLLYVKPANVGYFLQRLDRGTGAPVWPRPQLLAVKRWDAGAWTLDAEAVYGIEDGSLTARSLADGRLLWRRSLPAGAGHVRRIADYLAVLPGPFTTETRFRFRSPFGSVQWDLGPLRTPESLCSMSCYDPKTGQLVQRLNFRIETPPRTTPARRTREESGRWRLVRTSSLLATEDGTAIRLDSPRPFVAIGGAVWGLLANGRR
jgi:outer membrane protein assembly factor BamB